MRALILAAGLGTRLKPLTDAIPKALIKINDFTLLELQIKKLISEGFDKIIINVHHFSDKIKTYLEQNNFFDCDISISDETDKLLDTGGGLKKASHFFSDGKPFLVYNVDVLSDLDFNKFYEFHVMNDSIATLAVSERKSSRYFLFNKENIICGWVNDKTGESKIVRDFNEKLTKLAFSGIQIIDPKLFKYFPDENVFSLIDLYLIASRDENIRAFIHSKDGWMDLGKIENLKEAELRFDKFRVR